MPNYTVSEMYGGRPGYIPQQFGENGLPAEGGWRRGRQMALARMAAQQKAQPRGKIIGVREGPGIAFDGAGMPFNPNEMPIAEIQARLARPQVKDPRVLAMQQMALEQLRQQQGRGQNIGAPARQMPQVLFQGRGNVPAAALPAGRGFAEMMEAEPVVEGLGIGGDLPAAGPQVPPRAQQVEPEFEALKRPGTVFNQVNEFLQQQGRPEIPANEWVQDSTLPAIARRRAAALARQPFVPQPQMRTRAPDGSIHQVMPTEDDAPTEAIPDHWKAENIQMPEGALSRDTAEGRLARRMESLRLQSQFLPGTSKSAVTTDGQRTTTWMPTKTEMVRRSRAQEAYTALANEKSSRRAAMLKQLGIESGEQAREDVRKSTADIWGEGAGAIMEGVDPGQVAGRVSAAQDFARQLGIGETPGVGGAPGPIGSGRAPYTPPPTPEQAVAIEGQLDDAARGGFLGSLTGRRIRSEDDFPESRMEAEARISAQALLNPATAKRATEKFGATKGKEVRERSMINLLLYGKPARGAFEEPATVPLAKLARSLAKRVIKGEISMKAAQSAIDYKRRLAAKRAQNYSGSQFPGF